MLITITSFLGRTPQEQSLPGPLARGESRGSGEGGSRSSPALNGVCGRQRLRLPLPRPLFTGNKFQRQRKLGQGEKEAQKCPPQDPSPSPVFCFSSVTTPGGCTHFRREDPKGGRLSNPVKGSCSQWPPRTKAGNPWKPPRGESTGT